MPLVYQTIQSDAYGIFKSKGSKFEAYASQVRSEDDVKAKMIEVKKLHPKARHHCFGLRIGTEGLLFRANDDGEPSGSAGRPILGQIDSANLTNTLIIVVRYFGGTLLGVPGLINAYKNAARDAISQAKIVEKEVRSYFRIDFDYEVMNELMELVKKSNFSIEQKNFTENPSLNISVAVEDVDRVNQISSNLRKLKVSFLYTL